ncbi:MAG: tripartite tricarboxylate transporter TctB family protein [Syntrophaceae bacterium]|nr:tripartite tricarboxylate transporter TctB family protein [Syntrophaceae bacterium]
MNSRLEKIAFFLIVVVSVAIMFISTSYGIGSLAKPEPGMYPFVVGLFILPFSLILFIGSLRAGKGEEKKKEAEADGLDLRQIGIFALFMGCCAFWILAMPWLGYPLVTFIVAFLLSKIIKLEGWVRPLLLAGGIALFVYLLFDVWLYLDLPRGFWG